MKRRHILTLLFIIYMMGLVYITLFAWNYGASLGPEGPGGRNYNLIPFRSIYRISMFSPTIMDPIRILIGNIILFIPFGILLAAIFPKLRHSAIVILFGFMTSCCIEICQFLFTYRVANIDDVLLNTSGTLIGYYLFSVLYFVRKRVIIYVN
ncbi:VanZ family protein [Bacillus sp. JCM 19034]|uniref:VanZ family protein n=1 Tax=Bacillus sp. JCM 19034 TaxID=1481928 RepID=UPI000AA894C6|nr:VanZ family protein [Bacillus sp. JCM 19034]